MNFSNDIIGQIIQTSDYLILLAIFCQILKWAFIIVLILNIIVFCNKGIKYFDLRIEELKEEKRKTNNNDNATNENSNNGTIEDFKHYLDK